MADPLRLRTPWLLVAAAVLLLALLLYVVFAGWLPAKQRVTRLEGELNDVYAREAILQTRMAQEDQRGTLREQQMNAMRVERDALARRIDELERQLAATRPRRR